MAAYVSLQNVIKSYHMGEITVHASDGITFDIEKGEFAVVVGPSGAGKTTVLNMLGGMDTCDEGKILVDGAEISSFSRKELTTYRRYDIGFVFQFYNLVQNLTALENVELAAYGNPSVSAMDSADLMRCADLPLALSGTASYGFLWAHCLLSDSKTRGKCGGVLRKTTEKSP